LVYILAPDGKRRFADVLDYNGIILLGKTFPGNKANRFIEWINSREMFMKGIDYSYYYEEN